MLGLLARLGTLLAAAVGEVGRGEPDEMVYVCGYGWGLGEVGWDEVSCELCIRARDFFFNEISWL